jgi:hypothetical protein
MHNMTSFESQTLINWFLYQMTMEQREKLMRELPTIYNLAVNAQIVKVVRVSDNQSI